MGIRIKSIHVQELGPIKLPLKLELGLLNLIYGHNEKGKTFLVEFIIQSLFKNRSSWNFRGIKGSGKIIMDGLEQEFAELSPASEKNKLEDFLNKEYPGLPPDLSKLMVVKGAELVFDDSAAIEGGINKAIIKNYLSSRGVFEKIRSSISKTVQGAAIHNRAIEGQERGKLKERKEIRDKLNTLDGLFTEINSTYSGGSIKELEAEKVGLEHKKDGLLYAKQHLAFNKNEELKNNKAKSAQIDQEIIMEIDKGITNYKLQENKCKRKQEEQKTYAEKSRHYEWLKNAYEIYEKSSTYKPGVATWLIGLIFFSLASVIVFSVFNILLGIIFSAVVWVVSFLFFLFYQRIVKADADLEKEKRKVEEDFKERFKEKLKNKAHLKTVRDTIGEYHNNNNLLLEQLKTEREDLNALETQINIYFNKIGITDVAKEKWDNKLKELQNTKKSYDEIISALEKELEEVKNKIISDTSKLETLKQRICDVTRNNISESWDSIILLLQQKLY